MVGGWTEGWRNGAGRPCRVVGRIGWVGIATGLLVIGCGPEPPDEVRDLPQAAGAEIEGVTPVPEGLLVRAGHPIERVAVGPDGLRVYGAIRDGAGPGPRLVEWVWHEEMQHWMGPDALHFSDGSESDTAVAIAPDGSYLLFASSRPVDLVGAGDMNIWLSQWREDDDGAGWSDPWLLPTIHSPAWDGGPSLAMNGNLYFASERDAPTSGRNLFLAELEGGNWMSPRALPSPVNSDFDEIDPWIAPDESFILFASNREGAFDLYASYADGVGGWTEPQRFVELITTEADERAPVLSLGGQVLFFVRDDGELWWSRSGSSGVEPPE